jgi:hypothetical protein
MSGLLWPDVGDADLDHQTLTFRRQPLFHQLTNGMQKELMSLLNASRLFTPHQQLNIG